ncbi:hypothetical protein BUALT_Bualt04G0164100 [Buddleja alternifolia]|uniref:Uncharacterized protein n=1 Tax=Buddleja alternifolia TaxID=168488 RepID=A0AAV6Y0B0_9LAMI|nr:hypothetical protein BUALT_Bualt04G0164100 [Buddleja alternifolia]
MARQSRAWLIDSRGLAKKVKNASLPVANQIKDCGANRQCPNCHFRIDNTDMSHDWPGLPAGVKFDPSDVELLENLAAKCGVGDLEAHIFIDEFIPTLEGDEGICYTHPENLPGAKKDGSSVHFFYRIRNAYASGRRKRRRIHEQEGVIKQHVRWHKTGKTKRVMENGVQKGCKKIMVLYATSKKGSKPDKCNWIMHQYHLGTDEDEREGEYVVSKIFYQPQKETDKNEISLEIEESDVGAVQVIPRTPKTITPDPPRMEKTPSYDCGSGYRMQLLIQEGENLKEPCRPSCGSRLEGEIEYDAATYLGGDSDAVDLSGVDSLLCNEIIDSYDTFADFGSNNASSTQVGSDLHQRDGNATCGISDLDNLELDTPPDFHLNDLQFASQDSVFDWLDRNYSKMFAVYARRNLQNNSFRTLSSLLLNHRSPIDSARLTPGSSNVSSPSFEFRSVKIWNCFDGGRDFSAKSMRSKVEKRMQRESGKTLREVRRAKKLRKKLMTDEERLIYNLRRAKKKVALLLQKLKKYELPELPPPRHDPELLTLEQLQAYKKIGFRNKNYVPVGVRGVFGGVVQNMHLHWKFHETVQVCCDNFPKEKIKEMATMLARLSGGVVVNIHNVKTIIMFRGRNYRQPKNLIPVNTLTKRKALFKARFEQALESQKLNIKKTEQELRRKGVNPDDPVAMASIQRVASTFFNAIDQREGSPYIFREDKTKEIESEGLRQPQEGGDDSDQEELDRFIAEIEDAADKEWAAEEAAEKEELGQIRYWNRDNLGGRFRRYEDSDVDDEWDSHERWQHNKIGRANNNGFKRNETESKFRMKENTISDDTLSDLEDSLCESNEREGRKVRESKAKMYNYESSSDDENYEQLERREGRHSNKEIREDSGKSSNELDEHLNYDYGENPAVVKVSPQRTRDCRGNFLVSEDHSHIEAIYVISRMHSCLPTSRTPVESQDKESLWTD